MRRGVLVVLSVVAAAVGLTVAATLLRTDPSTPTVVVVSIDTLRADHVGPRSDGDAVSLTPALDELAADSAVFDAAWTVSPLTVPAHATLLCGQLPPLHGLRTNHPAGRLTPLQTGGRTFPMLAEVFRDQGHRTAAFVSASVLRDDRTGLGHGFDVYDAPPPAAPGALHDSERRGAQTVAAALDWIGHEDRPAFLFVHLFDPHFPYDAPAPWGAGPSERGTRLGYEREVAYADHCVGLLLDGLRAAGLGDAVVVVTADHGEGLGEHGEATHGYLLHEATLHVPLIVHAPGRLAPRRSERVVSLAQVAPTIVTLAGLPVPTGMPTTTLLDKGASGPGEAWAESLYAWESFRWAQLTAYRTGADKTVETGAGGVLLYDLSSDPRELEPARIGWSSDSEAVRGLARVREHVLRSETASAAAMDTVDLSSVPYFGGGTASLNLLGREENAELASPYERIELVARMDQARTLLLAGRADAARRILREVRREDPGNPEAAHWLGRALLAAPPRHTAAFDAFEQAFDLGHRSAKCVTQALLASVRSAEPDLLQRGAEFLERARGQGVRDDAKLLSMAAAVALAAGDRERARREVDALRAVPRTEEDDRALQQLEQALQTP